MLDNSKKSPTIPHIYPDGAKYEGGWKDGKPHGEGTMTYANGAKYEGGWKDNTLHGQGTMTYVNGDKYEGAWKDGQKNGQGQGTMTYANGDKYEGGFKDGQRNGQGTMTYPGGDKYEGAWKDGQKNGQGTMTFTNGDKYEGAWKDATLLAHHVQAKQQKLNKRQTIIFQSKEMTQSSQPFEWEHNRFTSGGLSVERYDNTPDAPSLILKLEELQNTNAAHCDKFRLVFHQHGSENGSNDFNITQENAKTILGILYSKGYRDIVVSDLACHGATASHFTPIAQNFIDNNKGMKKIIIRSSDYESSIISMRRQCQNGKFMSTYSQLNKGGQARVRGKTVYKNSNTKTDEQCHVDKVRQSSIFNATKQLRSI